VKVVSYDLRMIAKICVLVLVSCGLAVGQKPAARSGPSVQARPLAFEVVSIRPSAPNSDWGGIEILPDGYRAWGIGLWATVARAYFATDTYSPDRLRGQQSWMSTDKYDIVAKVAPSDVVEWQRQGKQEAMLKAMLQTMLAERCRLVVHRIPAEIDGYALMVGKHGAKMKEAKPGEAAPAGVRTFPDGGWEVGYRRGIEEEQITYYATSMDSFAHDLFGKSVMRPVENKTGLAGRYDFALAWLDLNPQAGATEGAVSLSDGNPLWHWDFAALGLKVEPVKISSETVVIDHIERPSAN
jgi:uncharacterized protein (TIGR03435 family)